MGLEIRDSEPNFRKFGSNLGDIPFGLGWGLRVVVCRGDTWQLVFAWDCYAFIVVVPGCFGVFRLGRGFLIFAVRRITQGFLLGRVFLGFSFPLQRRFLICQVLE